MFVFSQLAELGEPASVDGKDVALSPQTAALGEKIDLIRIQASCC